MANKSKSSENVPDKEKNKDNPILAEIRKLTAQVNELSTVREEISALKKQLGNRENVSASSGQQPTQGSFSGTVRNNRRSFKCKSCEGTNSFFNHCFISGSTDHRKNECSMNPKNV